MKINHVEYIVDTNIYKLKDLYRIDHFPTFDEIMNNYEFKCYFDHETYENIMKDFIKELKYKWFFIRFLSERKIISKLRKFLDNYYWGDNNSTKVYTYRYFIKANISLYLNDNYHTTYYIHIYDIQKDGPYCFY